jgi:hypothetical protein
MFVVLLRRMQMGCGLGMESPLNLNKSMLLLLPAGDWLALAVRCRKR